MLDIAASGGYYVALVADTIVAHPTSVTGSIGVLMVTLSAEGLMQKLGLSTTTIKSAERKDMGSPFRPMTGDVRFSGHAEKEWPMADGRTSDAVEEGRAFGNRR